MPQAAGYSGTPLPKKLGLKDGQVAVFIDLPDDLSWLRDAAAFSVVADSLGAGAAPDFVHVFATEQSGLRTVLEEARTLLHPSGMVWASWPKKASKRPTDITEDVIRDIALPMGFVDVKVCAVDPVWSGLKLMIRKDLR